MRVPVRTLTVATLAIFVSLMSVSPASAQAPAPLEGNVVASADRSPIEGAVVDIYRTDIKGKFNTKTDKKGNFTYPVPQQGTFTVIVSAPGYAAGYKPNIRLSATLPRVEFSLDKGNGSRPSIEEVERFLASGGGKESAADAEARMKAEAEYAKAKEQKEQFDGRKARFDAGAAAMQSQDYTTAITEFAAAISGLEDADPAYYGELIGVGGTNLAETHYRVAVDLFNQSLKENDKAKKDAAKDHLMKGARAIAMSIKFMPTGQSVYAIQGKTLALLVDKFGETEQADTGANAYLKASEIELDQKKKIDYLVMAGDVYRYGYQTDKAVSTYKMVLASDPNNLSAYYGIGLACMGTLEENDAKRREVWQTAADYLKVFAEKAGSDPRAAEVKGLLDGLAKDFKIKPRPIK